MSHALTKYQCMEAEGAVFPKTDLRREYEGHLQGRNVSVGLIGTLLTLGLIITIVTVALGNHGHELDSPMLYTWAPAGGLSAILGVVLVMNQVALYRFRHFP